ncbi:hypothetical protein BTS2_3361 [Bacillus sp. TS-2]|nr:hypothetical protein BTS2_3361 [Bacillus sp. TS-2]
MLFKKQKILSIDELSAIRAAYGNPLQKKEVITYVITPFIVVFLYSFILYYYWWLSLILGLLASFYGYIYIIPQELKRTYEQNAFRERNKFINNMTQLLINDKKTVHQALSTVIPRAEGEFKDDLEKVQAKLLGENDSAIHLVFQELNEKYKQDVVFSMFAEQLTNALIEGRATSNTIKDIKTYHNDIKKRQIKFLIDKDNEARDFKKMSKYVVVAILILSFAFDISRYIEIYAHHPIGWIGNSIYLLLLFKVYHSYLKNMGDDSVMEVKV